MAPRPNPYTPGAGDRPRVLVGREEQLALADGVRRQIEAEYAANCLVFTGSRGVGKTVLLKEVTDRLIAHGWVATYVQIRRSVGVDKAFGEVALRAAKDLKPGAKVRRALADLAKRGGGLQVLATGPTIGPSAADVYDGYRTLSSVLETLGSAAHEDGLGIALIVDELQALRLDPLGDLIHLVLDLRDRVPLAFIGGGLPYLPSYITKATTSTERFRFEPTDFLAPRDVRLAVRRPAEMEGVEWEEDALDRIVELAEGYPFFLQLYASETWEEASRERSFSSITIEHLELAEPRVHRLLEHGLYGSRFEQTKPVQRAYLYAMVELSGVDDRGRVASRRVRSGDVAAQLGRSIYSVAPTREALIRAGVIHSPDYGELEFSIPGFAQYLQTRREAGDA